jgi:ABC-type sugar transport system permease subunit
MDTVEPYAGRAGRSPAHRGDWRVALILLIPAAAGFLVFAAYPALRGIYLSFTDFRILTPPTWSGLANYRQLLSDSVFWNSLRVTAYYVVLTVVVAALVWQWILDPGLGIVNVVVKAVFGHSILFLGSQNWVIPSLAFIGVWKSMGYNAILIFAGLQTIPGEIYEAGRLDGAGEVRLFTRLTLPLLRPIMAMVVILTVISSFQVFDLVAVTTEGGPANASNVLPLYIYETGFSQFDFGYALTMSTALFVMLLAITFLQMRLLRANESDTN